MALAHNPMLHSQHLFLWFWWNTHDTEFNYIA